MAARSRKRADSGGAAPSVETEAAETPPDFETSLTELESIVDRLEEGDLPLEEALASFEAGVALTRRCAEQLAAVERRVEVLMRNGAKWITRPFEATEEAE
jgi:exodeoxyribonuclease VII small subunit